MNKPSPAVPSKTDIVELTFASVRRSKTFLKPQRLPPGADSSVWFSFVLTLFALMLGWLILAGITVALTFHLSNPIAFAGLIGTLFAHIGLGWNVFQQFRRMVDSQVRLEPAILTNKRMETRRLPRESSDDYYECPVYYLQLMYENGSQLEYQVDEAIYVATQPPCAGVAFLHSFDGSLLQFDAVDEA